MKNSLYLKVISVMVGGLVMFSSLILGCANKKTTFDFNKVLEQIYDYEMHISNLNADEINKNAENTFDLIQADGSFSDIDYKAENQTNWAPAGHLTRLRSLVLAYVNPSGKYYASHEAYEKIEKGLTFWQKAHPVSTNWYMQEISSPQNVGAMLVLMRFGDEKIPKKTEKSMLKRMKKTGGEPQNWTGANKADISVHYLYRGALSKNEELISLAANEAFSTLKYTMEEGFQHDNSYQQHGPQLYITGYGSAVIKSISVIASAVDGTLYQMNKEAFAPLQGFINETYIRAVRGRYRLYNTGGRSLSRENSLDVSSDILLYEKLKLIDKENASGYDDVIARLKGEKGAGYMVKTLNTHYWRSDYTLHTSPLFTFDVRTVSNRTARNENGNKENLKGYFLSDGAYSINIEGDEYNNIFPVWDFSLIPGTTTPHLKEIPLPEEWGTYGKNTFAGGLSNGEAGISAYAYNDVDFGVNTSANKSYFMLGNMIVCIGSDINSSNENEIRTTLNQCLSNSEAIIINNNKTISVFEKGIADIQNVKGIYHKNVGYVFYDDNPITIKNSAQIGTWTAINSNSSNNNTIEKDVFSLSLSHGTRPDSDSYAYVLLPGINSYKEIENYNKDSIEVISNSKTLHAVKTADSDKLYAVFFSGDTLKYKDYSLTADNPCIIMLEGEKLYVSNPNQNIADINITIQTPTLSKAINAKMFSSGSEKAGMTLSFDLNA